MQIHGFSKDISTKQIYVISSEIRILFNDFVFHLCGIILTDDEPILIVHEKWKLFLFLQLNSDFPLINFEF